MGAENQVRRVKQPRVDTRRNRVRTYQPKAKWQAGERTELRKQKLRDEQTFRWFKRNFGHFFPDAETNGANTRMAHVRKALTFFATLDPFQLRYAMKAVTALLDGRPYKPYKSKRKGRNPDLDMEKVPTLYDPDEEDESEDGLT